MLSLKRRNTSLDHHHLGYPSGQCGFAYEKRGHPDVGSSLVVKIKSAHHCQQESNVGRNFMVNLGCPLFLTREMYSEHSVVVAFFFLLETSVKYKTDIITR